MGGEILRNKIIYAFIFTIIASVLPDIIIRQVAGELPGWINLAKFIILAAAGVLCLFIKEIRELFKFICILAAAIAVQMGSNLITETSFWKSSFDLTSFTQNIGSNILLKFISMVPIILLLFILLKSAKEFYLCKGDLSVKATKIAWLGINDDSISWGKLALISAVLISLGTTLLTIFTATGISVSSGTDKLLRYVPFIVLFAAANSFCEGVLYRSAVMGTLKGALPKKYVILIAAIFFGIPHYYGVPSGVVGAVMSCVLGWYMCRSMYETKGFAASWLIHFMQDTVVFSTLCLLTNLM
jgi:membrane protease YdiL (CAAX protease family)